MRQSKIVTITYSQQGGKTSLFLLQKLREKGYSCQGYLYEKYQQKGLFSFKRAEDIIRKCFQQKSGLVFVCAAGIAVRQISSFIQSKQTDCPVLVMDELGKFVIPVLSGHMGGANQLAEICAELTGATPVITTATDLHEKFAVDVFAVKNNLQITDMSLAKEISAGILGSQRIPVYLEECFVRSKYLWQELEIISGKERPEGLAKGKQNETVNGIIISPYCQPAGTKQLHLIPRQIILGIGCRKGASAEEIGQAVSEVLQEARIDWRAISRLCTIDFKKEEPGLLEFCRQQQISMQCFRREELAQQDGEFTGSAFVCEITGVDNVCERSAIAGGGERLIVGKQKKGRVTVAVAVRKAGLDFDLSGSGEGDGTQRGNIILFGGTTEGKLLVEYMEQQGIACYVSVATEYGKKVLPSLLEHCKILVGRMDQQQMEAFFREKNIRLVLDATHPYAVEVTRNITKACEASGICCIRAGRETTPEIAGAVYVSSSQEAVEYLNRKDGKALLTTGSKELKYFQKVSDYQNRLYARILPMQQAVQKAKEYGFSQEHLICGMGPYSVEQNRKMIEDTQVSFLVTKDTGKEGGFPEKAEAARLAGIKLLIIRRPVDEQGMTVEEIKNYLKRRVPWDE